MAVASPEPKVAVAAESPSSPRISFSTDFSEDSDFICINPVVSKEEKDQCQTKVTDFEFLSENENSGQTMSTADELFFEGKLLPFRHIQHSEKLKRVVIKTKDEEGEDARFGEDEEEEEEDNAKTKKDKGNRVSWFIDEDPSPRPPNCTVLWKELLRLKKQRARAPSPSASLSSSLGTQ